MNSAKTFAVVAIVLAVGLLVAGCAKAPTAPGVDETPIETPQQADQVAQGVIDEQLVDESDTVELGELV